MNKFANFIGKGLSFSFAFAFATIFLLGCASQKGPAYELAKSDSVTFRQPIRKPKEKVDDAASTINPGLESQSQEKGLKSRRAPTPTIQQAEIEATEAVIPVLSDEKVSRLAFNNMSISAFINEMFGNQLSLNFVLEPSVKNASDLVTLRISTPMSEKDTYALATRSLKAYGISTSLRDDILYFAYTGETGDNDVPLLVSGRTLPEVPPSSRPIMQIYPLNSVSTTSVRGWINEMFPKRALDLKEDNDRNALIIKGPYKLVQQAIAAIRLLDRPTMEGMISIILEPNLNTVTDLANSLESILNREGYSVRQTTGKAAIHLLPLESVGQLVVFARTDEILNHIEQWARSLEEEKHKTIENGLFSYQVQSTQATHIVQVLNSLGVANVAQLPSDATGASETVNPLNNTNRSSGPTASSFINNEDSARGKYAVDEQLNTILYSGSGKDWLQVLPIIKRLDKPAPSVLVEVILAEVFLDDQESYGVDWLRNTVSGDYNIDFGTAGRLGRGSSGFLLNLNNAGSTLATLNAFYENNKANIRSRPRIMVKSGGSASIDVGNEIPVPITSSQSLTDANALQVNSISYRNTGVILDIKPTVHASGFVDIEISQELSEASETSSSDIDAPTIMNRRIETTVTLRDGGSVLLGGLISSNTSANNQGVPVLGKLPIIGNLFKTSNNTQIRTELMVMVIPYIINSPEEAEALTDELQIERIDSLSNEIVPQYSN
jgi:general secretion pathway protein D